MPVPVPPVPLGQGCSTIYNNTLYSFSANAFQSLSLTKGANWTELPMGISVNGAVCVQATPPDPSTPAALYIVGGNANSSQPTYQGLQRYRFADNTWETLTPKTPVTQNRLFHDAVYLNSSASLFMYAGTQDGTMDISSQTFTISTSPPYNVAAFESSAPPSISPLLLPWSQSEAIMIGGSETNTKVMVFSPTNSWTDSGITLTQPLKNSTYMKAVVINGDDNSKNLLTFDLSVSPNQVNRTVLIDATGAAVPSASPIASRAEANFRSMDEAYNVKRRSLTLASWPSYNSTSAPTDTRAGYSLADNGNGLVIISGGNDNDPLSIFNARENSWMNASTLLSNAEVKIPIMSSSTVVSSTSSTSTVSTSSSHTISPTTASTTPSQSITPSSSSSSSSSGGGLSPTNVTILAAVLSSVVGLAMILGLCLCFLRRRRKRRQVVETGHNRGTSGYPADEKDTLDFADRGITLEMPADRFRGHGHQDSQGSFSSMAILMGKVSGEGNSRPPLGRRNGSNSSDSSSTFHKKYKNAISNPIPQDQSIPLNVTPKTGKTYGPVATSGTLAPVARTRGTNGGPRGSTRRSSGWNRYWSGGSTLNILGFGGKRATYGSGSERSSNSQYSDSGQPTRTTQDSAMVPPLNLQRPQGRMSRVASGSPTIAHAANGFPLKEGMTGQIERPHSTSSVSSYDDDDRRDAFSSGVPASVHDDPEWNQARGHGWLNEHRAPSSVYTDDIYSSNFPRSTSDQSRIGVPGGRSAPPVSRSPVPHMSDMSWLNLGGSSRV